jgi:two-component system, chemotaxis family, chemotaxis protein CheY
MDLMLADQKQLHVAIVEDERDLARMYEMILGKMGVPVGFVAYSGLEAIIGFKECTPKPQVVLMDNRLPSMSGVEATKAILAIKPDTRIIFLSADTGAREEAFKAGAALFISKPARISEIIEAISTVGNVATTAGTLPHPFANEAIGTW